jgi:hypothetical protein
MRRIDADELIKAIEQGEGFSWDSHDKDDLCVRKKYIDNAPTVELFCSYLSDGEVRQPCLESPCKHERPHGKWVYKNDNFLIPTGYWECSVCGIGKQLVESNFCPYCGSDNRGEDYD